MGLKSGTSWAEVGSLDCLERLEGFHHENSEHSLDSTAEEPPWILTDCNAAFFLIWILKSHLHVK